MSKDRDKKRVCFGSDVDYNLSYMTLNIFFITYSIAAEENFFSTQHSCSPPLSSLAIS